MMEVLGIAYVVGTTSFTSDIDVVKLLAHHMLIQKTLGAQADRESNKCRDEGIRRRCHGNM